MLRFSFWKGQDNGFFNLLKSKIDIWPRIMNMISSVDANNIVKIITICATESERLSQSTIDSLDKLENKSRFSCRNHKAAFKQILVSKLVETENDLHGSTRH